jgi:hypothetical protein
MFVLNIKCPTLSNASYEPCTCMECALDIANSSERMGSLKYQIEISFVGSLANCSSWFVFTLVIFQHPLGAQFFSTFLMTWWKMLSRIFITHIWTMLIFTGYLFSFLMARPPLGDLGCLIFRGFTITVFRHTTVGRIPLDEWPARRRDLYLTTNNIHTRGTSMPPVGFFSGFFPFDPFLYCFKSFRPSCHCLRSMLPSYQQTQHKYA